MKLIVCFQDDFLHAAESEGAGQGRGGLHVQRGQGERREADRVQQDQEVQGYRLCRVQGLGISSSCPGIVRYKISDNSRD